jgi:hypothetical protein
MRKALSVARTMLRGKATATVLLKLYIVASDVSFSGYGDVSGPFVPC